MANSKVQLADGSVLIDLTSDTVTAAALRSGYTAHDAAGNPVNGALEVDPVYSVTKTLTNVTSSNDDTKVIAGGSFYADLTPTNGYAITNVTVTMGGVDVTDQVFKPGVGGKGITANGTYRASDDNLSGYDRIVVNVPIGGGTPELQSKTVAYTPSTSTQTETVIADTRYDGLSSVGVTVNPIPSEYVVPSGTQTITENGTYNVSSLATAIVNVASGGSSEDQIIKTTNMVVASECNWYTAWQLLGFKFKYKKSTVLVVALSANTQTSGGNYTNNNMTISHDGATVVSPRESRWYYQQKASKTPLNNMAFRVDSSSCTWYYGSVATISADGSISPMVGETNSVMLPAGALIYAIEFPRSTSNGGIDLTLFGG